MKTIPAGQFKTHCLSLLDDVSQNHETLIVTKHGKPVAQILPINTNEETDENPLKNSIVFEKDIILPIEDVWEATL
ncbi:MAG: type II toxin-antitoxin system Phd/YefM family antitoxin [Candidatus Latescibacteria bacterium]|jgi:prevent-host-death family protein|nr:type II toxin-antitoxin system Phd/YefM family antitoxin [Candidatus Latescibacterota bacterium]MBT4141348.1 type II toxin-antitoxin system Phd/YefM family antitoxin [Candidatus Latescibacterota bacterium]MBT5829605.1 type II toxin-antitoxin system Phd/YefM family antitoxin [Candidatus Latescibacterota bacterium]